MDQSKKDESYNANPLQLIKSRTKVFGLILNIISGDENNTLKDVVLKNKWGFFGESKDRMCGTITISKDEAGEIGAKFDFFKGAYSEENANAVAKRLLEEICDVAKLYKRFFDGTKEFENKFSISDETEGDYIDALSLAIALSHKDRDVRSDFEMNKQAPNISESIKILASLLLEEVPQKSPPKDFPSSASHSPSSFSPSPLRKVYPEASSSKTSLATSEDQLAKSEITPISTEGAALPSSSRSKKKTETESLLKETLLKNARKLESSDSRGRNKSY